MEAYTHVGHTLTPVKISINGLSQSSVPAGTELCDSPFIFLLPARETSFAFFIVGSNAFFGIFALEAELLQLSFDCQGFGEGHFSARLNRALDTPNRLGCPVGRTELASVIHHIFPVVLRLVDIVDETQFLRLFKADKLAFGHHFNGLILGERARHTLSATRTGKNAQRDFRQTNLAGISTGDTNITGKRNLQAPTISVTIHIRNYQLGSL